MTTRVVWMLTALALTGPGVTACSSVDHGTITGKRYDPSWISYSRICTAYQQTEEEEDINGTEEMEPVQGPCLTYTTYQTVNPDCWEIDLRDGGDTGSQCVDQSTWDKYKVGQVYP